MGMRYAGFMAAARDDRLTREEREEAERVREDTYQRQIERDEAAHQRQLDLLDIRQKNALKLRGISAAKAQRKKDEALRKKIDALVKIQGLPDTPAVRSELADGLEVFGADTFITGLKSGRIRLNTPAEEAPSTEAPEYDLGTPVDSREADPTVDLSSESVPAASIPDVTRSSATPLSFSDTDAQMADMTGATDTELSMPEADSPSDSLEGTSEAQVEFSLGSPVEELEEAPESSSVFSYGNNPYIKISDYAGQDADTLEQNIRMLGQQGYSEEELAPLREELEFVKKAETEPEASFSELLAEADSFGKLNALMASQSELGLDEVELAARNDKITAAITNLASIQDRNQPTEKGFADLIGDADSVGKINALRANTQALRDDNVIDEETYTRRMGLIEQSMAGLAQATAPAGVSFVEQIGKADSFGKLNSLQGQLDAKLSQDPSFQQEYDRQSSLITQSMDRLVDINRQNAEKDNGTLMYFPITPSGTIGSDGMMVTVRDGKYFTPAGQEIPAEQINSGKLLPPDNYDTFVRNYNGQAAKIAQDVTIGTNTLQSLANYRELVINNPAGINKFITVGGQLVSAVNSAGSAAQAVLTGDYEYRTFENDIMNNLRDLSSDDKRIARAQLRAAYGMAAFSGSSGQALSDKELVLNLESIGAGITDPRKAVGVINDNIQDVIDLTEQKRKVKFDGFIATDSLRGTMATTPIGTVFSDYITQPGLFNETSLAQINEGYAGKTDYPFGSTTSGTPDFATWMEEARKRNPSASEAALKAFYDNKYGTGN